MSALEIGKGIDHLCYSVQERSDSKTPDLEPALASLLSLKETLQTSSSLIPLIKVDEVIRELDAATSTCHDIAVKLLVVVDKALVEHFILAPEEEQEAFLSNTQNADRLKQFLKTTEGSLLVPLVISQLNGGETEVYNFAIAVMESFYSQNPGPATAEVLWKCSEERLMKPGLNSTSQEAVVGWLIVNMPPVLNTQSQVKCLQWLFRSPSLNNDYDLWIEKLIPQNLLQVIEGKYGLTLLSGLKQNVALRAKLPELDRLIDDPNFKRVESLFRNIKFYEYTSHLSTKYHWIEIFEDTLNQLESNRFPHVDVLRLKVDSTTESFRKDSEGFSREDMRNAIVGKLFGDFTSLDHVVNKLFFHFYMDKLLIPEESTYNSFDGPITASAIQRSLRSLIDNSDLLQNYNPKTLNVVKRLGDKLEKSLTEFIFLCTINLDEKLTPYIIQKRIAGLAVGESYLIPAGCMQHATVLELVRTDANHFQITHFNTGLGVDTHPKRNEKFQTFLTYVGVPETSLSEDALKNFTDTKFSRTMDPVYTYINDVLAKGGHLLPPSENLEDYESDQSSGTCALQCLMAYLRHESMQVYGGTPEENKAFYKLVKANMFSHFHTVNLSYVDSVMQGYLPGVMNKVEADVKFSHLAENITGYNAALNTLIELLTQIGQSEAVASLTGRNSSTTLSRYAILRDASNFLSLAWSEILDYVPPTHPQQEMLSLALAKFGHNQNIFKNISKKMDELIAKKDLPKLTTQLARNLVATPFKAFSIQKIIEILGDETSPYEGMNLLLIRLHKYRIQSDAHVHKLIEQLNVAGKSDLATWTATSWQALESTPPTTEHFN